jgi:predicted alpha/beta superfamily hydrolase
MKTSFCLVLSLGLLCGCVGPQKVAARSPEKQTVIFSITNDVGFGNEVCVSGNHPDLGNDDPARAPKLHWSPGNIWRGQIAIQAGTALQYRFIKRSGSSSAWCLATNTMDLSPGNALTTAAQPPAPYTGKTILYHSSWTNAFILYQSGTNWINAPMTQIGPGRTPGEFLHRISGLGEEGEPLEFVPNNISQYDNSPYPGYGLNDYSTGLDVIFLQDKHIFNYRPPTNVSAPRIIVTNTASTIAGIPGRNLRIYLPRGYDQNTWKRYPVLYFHDGQNVFDPGGPFGSWSADASATRETSQGRMRESILVGVDNTANRIQEYLPPGDSYSGSAGWGDRYAAFLATNVQPFVNGNFRTLTNRDDTLTVGSSMGGLISAWLGWDTNYNTIFGRVGVMSSAFWVAPNFSARIGSGAKRGLTIYHDWGTAEDSSAWGPNWDVYNYWIADNYALNRELLCVIGCGHAHNEAAWAARLPGAYHYLLNLRDEPNRLALELYPSQLRVASLNPQTGSALLEFSTLKGASFDLLHADNLTSPVWQMTTSSPPETAAWSVRNLEGSFSPDDGAQYWQLRQQPLP